MATSTLDVRPEASADPLYDFYNKKLLREIAQLFKWEGLPDEVPYDYMEQALIKTGRVMFFYDAPGYGHTALSCSVEGVNIYGKPIRARAIRFTTEPALNDYQRTIIHRYDENVPKEEACVLIENMYGGEALLEIADFYAKRLATLQRAFDTNALWQNLPPIFTTLNKEMKQSIMKLFNNIASGEPWVIVDKEMLNTTSGIPVEYIDVKNKLADIYDAMNEVYNSFRETVGLNSPGADKKERLLKDEVNSNNESIQTCLQIMLTCRQVACEEINKVFGLNVSVMQRTPEQPEGEEDGTGDDRTEEPFGNSDL